MITAEDKRKILNEGLIVFDTCSLGRIYLMTRDAQKNMVDILKLLKDRIWIPAQVKLEFSVHHTELCHRALYSCYEFGKSHTQVTDYIKSVSVLQERLNKPEFHPYYSQDACEKIEKSKKQLEEAVAKIEEIKNEQWELQRDLIKKTAAEDDLFQLFLTFQVGEGYSIDELIAIAVEGEERYNHLVPPGYADRTKKNGIQQYGDLILWKEILRKAKNIGKDVLFVGDDIKEDWNVNKTDMIRPELEKEFQDETGHKLLKLRLEKFIEELENASQETDNSLPLFVGLDFVKHQLLKESERKERAKKHLRLMTLHCDGCGHEFEVGDDDLCMEWEPDGVDERSMGPEYSYISHNEITCPKCRKQIELTMYVWEYPVGAFNYQDIKANGAKIVEEMNLEGCVPFMSENFDTCMLCGERKELMDGMDICYDCYRSKMNELEKE